MPIQGNYSAIEVSRHIINYCSDKGHSIGHLQLQKILYFVQAQFLRITRGEVPCFTESIAAWAYGPVVPVVYDEYKRYGSSVIPKIQFVTTLVSSDSSWKIREEAYDDSVITEEDCAIINSVVDLCLRKTPYQLVDITHQQAPWKEAYAMNHNGIITNNAIYDYYREQ